MGLKFLIVNKNISVEPGKVVELWRKGPEAFCGQVVTSFECW